MNTPTRRKVEKMREYSHFDNLRKYSTPGQPKIERLCTRKSKRTCKKLQIAQ